MSNTAFIEYLWIDGALPTQQIRSKARICRVPENPSPTDFPDWSFDGSSTGQATGDDSDCILSPVRVYRDPLRSTGNYIVLCEVRNPDGTAHASNQRSRLRGALDSSQPGLDAWIGFEQEYTLFQNGRPLGFPADGYPAPQGQYYCGAGVTNVFGRELVEEHAAACVKAGIRIYGINAEVMPGQWEFQVGYRGISGEACDPLTIADDVWVARYLLHRIGERHRLQISFENKPVQGDWNGAGMHTNFSTAFTRNTVTGIEAIKEIVAALQLRHTDDIVEYGDRLAERLTGDHETCDIATFKSGIANRGASIRIPQPVALQGYGYLEDRRPGANSDPYRVARCLIAAVNDHDTKSGKRAA